MTTTTAHSTAEILTLDNGDAVIDPIGFSGFTANAQPRIVICRSVTDGSLIAVIAAPNNSCGWRQDGGGHLLPDVGPAAIVQGF